jgi:replication factor C subunit 2/4
VHFICSCTNLKKIIESIQSRLIIIPIPKVDDMKLNKICKIITSNENIVIQKESYTLFFKYCEKSLRIMINYLEKFKLYNSTINDEVINSLCTNINDAIFDKLIVFIKKKELLNAIELLKNIYDQGYSVMDILDCFFSYVKLTTTLTDEEKYKVIPYICKYIHIFHDIHEDEIELSLFINNIIKLI